MRDKLNSGLVHFPKVPVMEPPTLFGMTFGLPLTIIRLVALARTCAKWRLAVRDFIEAAGDDAGVAEALTKTIDVTLHPGDRMWGHEQVANESLLAGRPDILMYTATFVRSEEYAAWRESVGLVHRAATVCLLGEEADDGGSD